jgi:GDP-L-fucose synthase
MTGPPILITGGTGLVGTNLVERLQADGHEVVATGSERDLRDAEAARQLLREVKPDIVFHLAARVGGIYANSTQKPDFYRDNVLINTHVLDAAVDTGVTYVFAMGTGCAYPKRLEGALLREADYLDGIPEETNDAYAYAKRGMLVHLEALREHGVLDYCYCLPANLYGPHDNFHPEHSHVVPGLIRRFVEAEASGAEEVVIWGDGSAERDFLFIQDCVDAMVRLCAERSSGAVNVATGRSTSVLELAETIRDASGFAGRIGHDLTKPSGQMGRLFDTDHIRATGWTPAHDLASGIDRTVAWFREHSDEIRSY